MQPDNSLDPTGTRLRPVSAMPTLRPGERFFAIVEDGSQSYGGGVEIEDFGDIDDALAWIDDTVRDASGDDDDVEVRIIKGTEIKVKRAGYVIDED